VIIADTRSSMVAADSAAAIGCAFDLSFGFIRRGRVGLVNLGAERLESLEQG
jgi:hypothetical protein